MQIAFCMIDSAGFNLCLRGFPRLQEEDVLSEHQLDLLSQDITHKKRTRTPFCLTVRPSQNSGRTVLSTIVFLFPLVCQLLWYYVHLRDVIVVHKYQSNVVLSPESRIGEAMNCKPKDHRR